LPKNTNIIDKNAIIIFVIKSIVMEVYICHCKLLYKNGNVPNENVAIK